MSMSDVAHFPEETAVQKETMEAVGPEDSEPRPLTYVSENQLLRIRQIVAQKEYRDKYNPPPWLRNAEYPFKWLTELECIKFVHLEAIPQKLLDYENQGADYGFEKFGFLLTLSMLYYREHLDEEDDDENDEDDDDDDNNEDDDDDERNMKTKSEEIYYKCKEVLDEMASHEGDVMYSRIGPAFQHVLLATKSHMLFFEENIAESQEMANNIIPVSEMPPEVEAGINGIKAKYIMAMYKDLLVPIDASKKAIALDPDFGYWKYLTAKLMRRRRREVKDNHVSDEELRLFEQAVELERNPKFLVFLAQAYQEKALSLIRGLEASRAFDLQEKAVGLYRECWSLKNDSAPISRRVGNGMLKIKVRELQDLPLTKEALLKAKELSKNTTTIHALGKYYYIYEKDDEKALEYFQKCDVLYSCSEIIRLKLIREPNYDPKELIEYLNISIVNIAKEDQYRCVIGWYFLFIKNDLDQSVKQFWKVLSKDPESFWVKEFNCYAFCVYGPINMIDVLVNEIKLLKERNNELPFEERKDVSFFDKFADKIYQKHPDLIDVEPRPFLWEDIKSKVVKDIAHLRLKRYGYPRHLGNEGHSWQRNNRSPDNGRLLENRRDFGPRRSRNDSFNDNEVGEHNRDLAPGSWRRDHDFGDIQQPQSSHNLEQMWRRSNTGQDLAHSDNTKAEDKRDFGSGGIVQKNWTQNQNTFGTGFQTEMTNKFDSHRNITDKYSRSPDYSRNTPERREYGSGRFVQRNWVQAESPGKNESRLGRFQQGENYSKSFMANRNDARQDNNTYSRSPRYDVTVTDWRSENRSNNNS